MIREANEPNPGPPTVAEVAELVMGVAVGFDPVPPLSWTVIHTVDAQGAKRPLYLMAVVLGEQNIKEFQAGLFKLRPHMHLVEGDLEELIHHGHGPANPEDLSRGPIQRQ